MSTRIAPALRQRIAEKARHRCGYCLTSQHIIGPLLEVDHIIPEARGGSSEEDNLWLACPMCNSHKSDRMTVTDPETGSTFPLFHPHNESWNDHFAWIEEGTIVYGKTSVGRATIAALQMNHPDVVAARRLWVSVGWHPPEN